MTPDRKEQFWRDHDCRCIYCLRNLTLDETTVDHIVPQSAKSTPTPKNNLILACQPCNFKKGCISLRDFLPEIRFFMDKFYPNQLSERHILMEFSKYKRLKEQTFLEWLEYGKIKCIIHDYGIKANTPLQNKTVQQALSDIGVFGAIQDNKLVIMIRESEYINCRNLAGTSNIYREGFYLLGKKIDELEAYKPAVSQSKEVSKPEPKKEIQKVEDDFGEGVFPEENQFIGKKGLKRRGWNSSLISANLGKPDKIFNDSPLYTLKRVIEQENSEWFKNRLIKLGRINPRITTQPISYTNIYTLLKMYKWTHQLIKKYLGNPDRNKKGNKQYRTDRVEAVKNNPEFQKDLQKSLKRRKLA